MEGLAAALARLAPGDPVLTGAVIAGLALALIGLALRPARDRSAGALTRLAEGQSRMIGGLTQVTEAQVIAQTRMLALMEDRLDRVSARVGERLAGGAADTARALGALERRMAALDAAQTRIEGLSAEMLSLQALLSNKQARGALGEVQLAEILGHALPPDAYSLQPTLASGRRPDALIHLPDPPGPIAVDAKFPLESYQALMRADTAEARSKARQALGAAMTQHLRAVAERYVGASDTAEQAVLFLPSEAVFAELHANHAGVVRAGFALRVWITAPATLMAVLTTLRGILRDHRVVAEAAALRSELARLTGDVARLAEQAAALDRHQAQAADDLAAIGRTARRAAERARRIDALDFAPQPPAEAVPSTGVKPSNSGGPR